MPSGRCGFDSEVLKVSERCDEEVERLSVGFLGLGRDQTISLWYTPVFGVVLMGNIRRGGCCRDVIVARQSGHMLRS